jgi:hypothetical protein
MSAQKIGSHEPNQFLDRISKSLGAIGAVTVLLFAGSGIAAASVQYNFVSSPFNTFINTTCPPTCNLTGSFTVATALPPNLVVDQGFFTPISFSFTDGVSTVTNLTASFSEFSVGTNASGKIVTWDISADDAFSQMFAFSDPPTETQEGNNAQTYQAYFFGNTSGGSWTVVPEPSTLLMLGSSVFGLAGLLRKKLTR